jgi:hypothetical protein
MLVFVVRRSVRLKRGTKVMIFWQHAVHRVVEDAVLDSSKSRERESTLSSPLPPKEKEKEVV